MWEEWEIWRKKKELTRQKKANTSVSSLKLLQDNNIEYIEKPNWHYIIWDYNFRITTWLFIHKKTNKRWRGVRNLIKKLWKDISK